MSPFTEADRPDAAATLFRPRQCQHCQRSWALRALPFCAECLLRAGHGHGGAQGGNLKAGDRLAGYGILEKLGEGGFSEVYSARTEGGGVVAIKLLKPGFDTGDLSARFRAEQRLLRGLEHPGIVRVLESGQTPEGRSFFVMEQVDGLAITEFCEVEGLCLRARVELVVDVCVAVHHAHQKGVIHRDLKPSNILVEERGVAKVIDFGIARALDEDGSGRHTLVTRLGQVMGTPSYMPPEQAAGRDEADIRSDEYSLGAVLYEVLTGQPSYSQEALRRLAPMQWAAYLHENSPPPPSTVLSNEGPGPVRRHEVRGDLDCIVLKAMAREPEQRYASVEALAADLRQWLAGGVISARPPTLGYQLRQLVRRHKVPAALGAAGLALLVAGAVVALAMADQAQRTERVTARERDKAVRAEEAATRAEERAEHESYQAAVQLARQQIANGEPYLAAERLMATRPALRGWEWRYLLAALPPAEATVETGMKDATVLAASPDGHFAAVGEGSLVQAVDLGRGAVLARLPEPLPVQQLALSADGQAVASLGYAAGSLRGLVRVSRLDGSEAWECGVDQSADLEWEPDPQHGALLVVEGNGHDPSPGRLLRLKRETGQVLAERQLLRHKVAGRGITVSADATVAAVRTNYAVFEMVRLPGLERIYVPNGGDTFLVSDIQLDDRHRRLLYAQGNDVLAAEGYTGVPQKIGSMSTSGDKQAAPTAIEPIRRLNVLADGRWLAMGDHQERAEDGPTQLRPSVKEIRQVNLTGGRRMALLAEGRLEIRPETMAKPAADLPFVGVGEGDEARRVAIRPDSAEAVFQTWQRDGALLFPLETPGSIRNYPVPKRRPLEWSLLPIYHPDGTLLLAGDACLEALREQGGKTLAEPLPIPDTAWSAAVSPDGGHVLFGLPDRAALLDWKTRRVEKEWPLPGGPFQVSIAADGRTFYAWSSEGTLHRLSEHRAAFVLAKGKYTRPPTAAWHSGKGLWAVAQGQAVAIYALSASGPPVEQQRLKLDGGALALAFDPEATRLAVATEARTLTIWDWRFRLPLLELPVGATCSSVQFSPDGRWMLHTDFHPSVIIRRAVR